MTLLGIEFFPSVVVDPITALIKSDSNATGLHPFLVEISKDKQKSSEDTGAALHHAISHLLSGYDSVS
jgi:hypothetical protein